MNGNCLCSNGWKGSEDCSAFDCSNVNNCSGRGKCVGPNQCRCRVGWKVHKLSKLNAFKFSVYRVEHALQRIAICTRRVIRALGSLAAVGAILSRGAFLALA